MRDTQFIAVGNQKGGVGKTTNTVHLATALAEKGKKCLIIDLDMNHSATRHFAVHEESWLGTLEVLLGLESPDDLVLSTEDEPNLPENVYLISARRTLEGIDQALADKNKFQNPIDCLEKPFEQLKGHYDYVFLDTAPNATTPTLAAYKSAKWFILSAMPSPFSVAGIQDALEDIQRVRESGNPDLELLGVIVSGVDKRTSLANQLEDYIDDLFAIDGNTKLKFRTTIGHSTVIGQTQREGKTLFQTHPTHKLTDQYRELASELEERLATWGEDRAEVANG